MKQKIESFAASEVKVEIESKRIYARISTRCKATDECEKIQANALIELFLLEIVPGSKKVDFESMLMTLTESLFEASKQSRIL